MVKGRHLLSLPIINYNTGEQLAEIKDLIYDPYNNKLLGFILEEGNWFWGSKVLLLDQVYHIGNDVITVSSKDSIMDSAARPEIKELLKKQVKINGYKLLSERGKDIGTIQDLIIDPVKGNITGYEVSNGIVGDLLEGRRNIPIPQTITMAENALIIPGYTEDISLE